MFCLSLVPTSIHIQKKWTLPHAPQQNNVNWHHPCPVIVCMAYEPPTTSKSRGTTPKSCGNTNTVPPIDLGAYSKGQWWIKWKLLLLTSLTDQTTLLLARRCPALIEPASAFQPHYIWYVFYFISFTFVLHKYEENISPKERRRNRSGIPQCIDILLKLLKM